MSVTTKPEIRGTRTEYRDGRYRVYTVEHAPFDRFPSYRDGGPSKVAIGDWCTSVSYVDRVFSSTGVIAADDRMVTVGAHRGGHYEDSGTPHVRYVVERHPLDGQKFHTAEAADRAKYEAGLIGFMVYERDAERYGVA